MKRCMKPAWVALGATTIGASAFSDRCRCEPANLSCIIPACAAGVSIAGVGWYLYSREPAVKLLSEQQQQQVQSSSVPFPGVRAAAGSFSRSSCTGLILYISLECLSRALCLPAHISVTLPFTSTASLCRCGQGFQKVNNPQLQLTVGG